MRFWQPNPLQFIAWLSCGAAHGCLVAVGALHLQCTCEVKQKNRRNIVQKKESASTSTTLESIMDSTMSRKWIKNHWYINDAGITDGSIMDERWINDETSKYAIFKFVLIFYSLTIYYSKYVLLIRPWTPSSILLTTDLISELFVVAKF